MKGYLSVRKYQISGMSPSGGSASLPGTAGFPTWSGSGGRGQSKESKEEKTMTFDEAVQAIQPGRYRHFKGNAYEAIGVAGHSETEEPLAVYRALYGEGGLWARPADMWDETVERDGKTYKRF